MSRRVSTMEQKKANIDLWIILISTFLVLGTYIGLGSALQDFSNNKEINILLRTFTIAMVQFGVAGLGITIVMVLRKENIFRYGLRKKHLFITIILSACAFLPNIIFSIVTGEAKSYLPFQEVWITKDILASKLPIRIIGTALIATAWGFFEGFNYVVISDKINVLLPSKYRWLDSGAIICAIMCVLIHGAIGVTPKDFIEMITVLFIIYGLLMVRKFTGNAWGCVLTFIFLWNAY